MARYRQAAQIIRAKGLNGEVVAVSERSLPLHFWDRAQVCVLPPQHDLPRFCRVEAAAPLYSENDHPGDSFLIKLSDIADRSTAQKAVGCYISVDLQHCPVFETSEQLCNVGLEVIDVACGRIGVIVEERIGKAQTIWVVAGGFGEVLIPAVDSFVVTRDEHSITVDLPQGLLELNA
jgi:16S rRNA processing protein RimM